jgi:hypothetical protein
MAGIYLRQGSALVAMHETPYDTEAVLQKLIAEHPQVLAGDAVAADDSPWLLVRREAGVADAAEATARWSLDHLFLDAAGIPTLVEVKRSSDTRLRREVVAQMLDYASNAAHWTAETLRGWFEGPTRTGDPFLTMEGNQKARMIDLQHI